VTAAKKKVVAKKKVATEKILNDHGLNLFGDLLVGPNLKLSLILLPWSCEAQRRLQQASSVRPVYMIV